MNPRVLMIVFLLFMPPAGLLIWGAIRGGSDSAEQGGESLSYRRINWNLLRTLDYKTGIPSGEVKDINGTRVMIPGFVVPLSDSAKGGAKEFLLVPSPQACIHVPPPPPNQMIYVEMVSGTPPERAWGPVWVKGKIKVQNQDSEYGQISYRLFGQDSEKYQHDGG